MQLVAYGAQDVYLTGNPTITFFKIVYKRYTNFAIEPIDLVVIGDNLFGSELTCNVPLNGDLITKMYLKCDVSLSGTDGKFAWVNKLGHSLITEINFNIGGTQIDKQYGEWLNLWYELVRNTNHDRGYDKLIGNNIEMTSLSTSDKNATLYIPLKFFFNKFNGLAVPLVALLNTNVVINFKLRNSSQLIVKEKSANVTASISNISILCNYVFLDSEERQRFARANHEYLIEQVQYSGIENVENLEDNYILKFNHPCKSLYWMMKNGNFIQGLDFLYYVSDSEYIYRAGYFDITSNLIKYASIRYVLTQMYSNNGIINLKLDGTGNIIANSESTNTFYEASSITSNDGLVTIQANYNSMTIDTVNNTATCSANNLDNWEVIVSLSIDNISKPISILFDNIARTTDINNKGHSDYDVSVYQWNNYGKYIDSSINPIKKSVLTLNGNLRFAEQESEFFNYLQPYENHKSTPKDGINLYSFALNPIEHQPSGTCNFSRIDSSILELKFDPDIVNISGNQLSIYTFNYNILKIMEGTGDIAYNN